MVAATAAKLGLKCILIQEKWAPHYDAVYDRVGNILLTRLMGAEARLEDGGFSVDIRSSWEEAIRSVEAAGGRPYAIPAGASAHPLGGIGYAAFAAEVTEQERAMGVHFDYVVVCVVTGSTLGGMIVGFADQGRADRAIGIHASGTPMETLRQLRGIIDVTAEQLELNRRVDDSEIRVELDYAYPCYGVPSNEANSAIMLAAQTEAMITDPVYEGKSMQAMMDLIRKEVIPAGSRVLYVHLGGVPALNGYSYYYR